MLIAYYAVGERELFDLEVVATIEVPVDDEAGIREEDFEVAAHFAQLGDSGREHVDEAHGVGTVVAFLRDRVPTTGPMDLIVIVPRATCQSIVACAAVERIVAVSARQ